MVHAPISISAPDGASIADVTSETGFDDHAASHTFLLTLSNQIELRIGVADNFDSGWLTFPMRCPRMAGGDNDVKISPSSRKGSVLSPGDRLHAY